MRLGNINENTFNQIYNSLGEKFLKHRGKVQSKCMNCKYFSICHGGCSYLAYSQRYRLDDKDFYCAAYRRIFEHIEAFLKQESVPIDPTIIV